MKEDFLDKAITKAFKEKTDKPDEYKNVILNTLNNHYNEKRRKNVSNLKRVACLLLFFLLITSAIGIKDISAYINKYLLMIKSNKGIQEAIGNGYIKEVDMEYINSNGVDIRIKEILMDNFNLLILFNIKIPEIESLESIYNVKFENLVIMDEQDNVIVLELENNNKYKEFYKQRNIETNSTNIAHSNGTYYGQIITKNSNSLEYKYTTHSENFPKSKSLKISFDKIILESKASKGKKIIEGDWKMDIALPKEMYNREAIIYNVKECNKNNIILTKAQVSNTEMKIELITKWGEPVYTEKDSEEERNKKIEEFFYNSHSLQSNVIKNEYVINERGIKYYPVVNSSDANGGYNKMFNGYLRYWQTFELTKYNATEELKIMLEIQGEVVEIICQAKV